MHNEFDTKLDEALTLLLEGESLSTLRERFPEYTNELSEYQTLLSLVGEVSSVIPSEEGLRSALVQMKSPAVATAPVQSPYFSFFVSYRNVLVLPVLLVVLISGGVLVYPSYRAGESTAPVPTETSISGSTVTSDNTQAPTPSEQVAMQKTSAPEARTMMMANEPEVDPELQEIFAYSDSGSEMRSAEEEQAARDALNDSSGVQPFSNTYDNTF